MGASDAIVAAIELVIERRVEAARERARLARAEISAAMQEASLGPPWLGYDVPDSPKASGYYAPDAVRRLGLANVWVQTPRKIVERGYVCAVAGQAIPWEKAVEHGLVSEGEYGA